MSVEANNPIIIPPQPEKAFDKLWISSLTINATTFAACRVQTVMRPYTVNADGTYEFAPADASKLVRFSDQNWFDLYAREPFRDEAVHDALASMGVNVPEGVPATQFLVELIARSCGAVAQAVAPTSFVSSETSESDVA